MSVRCLTTRDRQLALGVFLVMAFVVAPGRAQEREDRTLLSWAQMHAIVDEASGERAMQTVQMIAPFPGLRPASEYTGHFHESDAMARLAREYGFSDVQIETYPLPAPLWQASEAQLWMVEPQAKKLYDAHDVNLAVVAGSDTGDLTADVADVGTGQRAKEYAGIDVSGKIVLGSGPARGLQQLGVFERGAVGLISYDSHRPNAYPDEVLDQEHIRPGPSGKSAGFAWAISPRVARELLDGLHGGRRVRLRSVVKAESFPGKHEMVHAMIPGDGSSPQAIVVSAHLFEQHLKQGANDDASGCAVTLEMGRTLLRLVAEGKLPRPRRDIHFTWIDEVRGTREWLKRHDDVRQRLIADLNFDQVGNGLLRSSSLYVLHRTPDTLSSYLNDVGASFLEFVDHTNRERAVYRTHGFGFSMPVVAPTGTHDDPFITAVAPYWPPSDHRVYLDQGIPAVLFNDWPDMWYHSSYDRPDRGILDPTQMKRAAVVGAAFVSLLASADDELATRAMFESLGRGSERMAAAVGRGLGFMADAQGPLVATAYKEALNALRHQMAVERDVVKSAAVLFADRAAGERAVASVLPLVEARAAALQNELAAAFRVKAEQYHLAPTEPPPSAAETLAARQVPERTKPLQPPGVIQAAIAKLPPADEAAVAAALARMPAYESFNYEFNALLQQKETILEIRDFLSGEFDPLPLADLLGYLHAQEKLGFMRIVERPGPKGR